MKEIHFYETFPLCKNVEDYYSICRDWNTTEGSIKIDHDFIATTQMGLLSTQLFNKGYQIFIHEDNGEMYEIKLGSDNERTNREIRKGHNLFKLWKNGEFKI